MDIPNRKIAHMDMDCFYAAVEMRDHPELRDKPLAIGGAEDRRGVLCTCNYMARKFGVRSAMPSSHALRLCPQLVLMPPDMDRYKVESQRISAILHRYTDRIEPLSLDEAYLDLTGNSLHNNSATRIMQEIRQVIAKECGLTASAGVAPNKFLAKIASDWKKPNGFFAITPEQVSSFVLALPVKSIPGVGRVLESRLSSLGLKTCADLQKAGRFELVKRFGNMGYRLFDLAHGRDDEPVVTEWVRKSLSVEETFIKDIQGAEQCLPEISLIFHEFLRRLHKSQDETEPADTWTGKYQLFVKIKYADFRQTTIERSFPDLQLDHFISLFLERYGASPRPVRLIGLGIRLPDPQDLLQIPLPLTLDPSPRVN